MNASASVGERPRRSHPAGRADRPARPFRRRIAGFALAVTALASVLVGGSGGSPARAAGHSAAVTRSQAQAAADVLMAAYDPGKAWFPSSWWNSAVALATIGDYMQRTGDRRYLAELDHTFTQDGGTFPAGYLSGDPLLGNFTSRAIDDSAWWGLTWVKAYDLTHNRKYLETAATIARYVGGYWDTGTCGGGVWWDAERTYKNAVTNGLWIRLTAELHNRTPGDVTWLAKARTAWNWYTGSGMINSAGLVNDGLTADCRNNASTVWSYNQGLAIGGGLELWRTTKDARILATVRRLADAGTSRSELVTGGVLTESCDPVGKRCDDNQKQFKGVFLRYLMDLADTTGDVRYARFVQAQAAAVWEKDRDDQNRLGQRWAGADTSASPNVRDWRTQASALSALIAALPARAGSPVSLTGTLSPAAAVVLPSATAATTQRLTLTVAGTAPGTATVLLRAQAPTGWKVQLPTQVRLRSSGSTVQVTVPMQATVPAGAAEGSYDLVVRLSAEGLAWQAVAHVLVATKADFDTGTAAEAPWLYDNHGSGSNGPGNRFADGDAHYTYRFPLAADTTSARVVITIDNQFVVQASPDNATWTTVLQEQQQIRDASNHAARTVDLTPYLSASDGTSPRVVYLKVSDAFPADGWGGQTSHVTVTTGS